MLHGHGDDAYHYRDIRINFSSNIYSHADLTALQEFLCSQIHLIATYPEPEPCALQAAIASKRGIPEECVVVTSGATEAIYLVAQMLSDAGIRRCHIPQPTFSEYADACCLFGLQSVEHGGAGVATWLCNPNNPTGEVYEVSDMPTDGILVVDQSYEDYTLQPLMTPAEAIARGNVIQLFSMTKTYAVPGLRIGYVVTSAELAAKLRAVLRPWSVNALAAAAGQWLVAHDFQAVPDWPSYLAEAQRLNRLLDAVEGLRALPTATNFMLCQLAKGSAAELKDYLARQHGILIRDASNFAGLDGRYFRVAAQLPTEDDALVAAVRQYLEGL